LLWFQSAANPDLTDGSHALIFILASPPTNADTQRGRDLMEAHPIRERIVEVATGEGINPGRSPLRTIYRSLALEPFLVVGGLYATLALYYTRSSILQLLSGGLLFGVAFYWSRALQSRPMSLADIKLSRKHLGRQVLIGVGLAFIGWIFFRTYVFASRDLWLPLGYGGSPWAILSIVSVALAEEAFFRGYLQNRLRGRYSLIPRVLLVVLALALYKNIIHIWTGMPFILHIELFAISALLSMITSLLLEWSNNLAGPIVLHVVWDLMVYGHLATIPYWVF
jgi:membrane protease YdiL (CAAX protease family)